MKHSLFFLGVVACFTAVSCGKASLQAPGVVTTPSSGDTTANNTNTTSKTSLTTVTKTLDYDLTQNSKEQVANALSYNFESQLSKSIYAFVTTCDDLDIVVAQIKDKNHQTLDVVQCQTNRGDVLLFSGDVTLRERLRQDVKQRYVYGRIMGLKEGTERLRDPIFEFVESSESPMTF